jgi:catechol 2,3-dioxygenase
MLGTSVGWMESLMSELPFAATTPVSVSRVGLKARDAESLAAYYRAVVGLQELSRADGAITLGAANRPLLVLEQDSSAKPDDPRSAGLFHTAFLCRHAPISAAGSATPPPTASASKALPTIWSARRSI